MTALKRLLMTSVHKLLRAWWFVTQPHTTGVRALALTEDGRVILVKHSYIKLWHLPGGGRKASEPAEKAVVRELQEEIGLTAFDHVDLLGEVDHRPDFKHDRLSVFLMTGVHHTAKPSLEIEKIDCFAPGALPDDISPAARRWIEQAAPRLAIA